MFERFTETARRALFFARYETTAHGGASIEVEHLLLGLQRADRRLLPAVLADGGLSAALLRDTITGRLGAQPRVAVSVEIPFSQAAIAALEGAKREADSLGHQSIDAGHLLLGILSADGSSATAFLREHGITSERVRQCVAAPAAADAGEPGVERDLGRPAGDSVLATAMLDAIRVLALQLAQPTLEPEVRRGLFDQLNGQLDALQRHIVG
jgi:ATP-dependent Clp protease ATP-binding subunit ClpA